MYHKNIACNSCNAEFTIKHEMMAEIYEVKCCPFCGDEIDEEDVEEITDN
tara:strand:- start:90 stop:239 length:150 start_codon:yes stop_codon:yes gene_type:complete